MFSWKYGVPLVDFVNDRIPDKSITFSIKPITLDFVINQLNAMDSSKATGLNGVSVNILKITAPTTAASITHICYLGIQTGQSPSQWKQAKVIHLFKSGAGRNCSIKFRPISILPVLSKILENMSLYVCMNFFKTINFSISRSLDLERITLARQPLWTLTEIIII